MFSKYKKKYGEVTVGLLLVLESISFKYILACLNEKIEVFELIYIGCIDLFRKQGKVSGKWCQSKKCFIPFCFLKNTAYVNKCKIMKNLGKNYINS